jgi:hypothetical protein
MGEGVATLSEKKVSADRVRRVRARRWIRGARAAALMLVVAAIPITLAIILTGDGDPEATTSIPAPAEVLVRNFDGTDSTSTGVFVVSANWVMKWQLDGLASDRIEISVRAAAGQDVETIVQEGLGAGERTFADGGAFRLVISSTGDWSIRVLQVTNPGGI